MRCVWAFAFVLLLSACGGSSEEGSAKKQDAGGDAPGGAAGTSGAAGASGGNAGAGGTGGTLPTDAGSGGTAGAVSGCSLAAVPPGTTELKLTSSGQERTARVVIPTSYDATQLVPLVLVFHGYTETAQQIEQISQMTPVAEKNGLVVVYPQGINTSWNAGNCCGSGSATKRPDVQFVVDLLDALEKQLCIDKKRIYSAGFSNGGMLSNRLACELSDRIAAIGPVAGPVAIYH